MKENNMIHRNQHLPALRHMTAAAWQPLLHPLVAYIPVAQTRRRLAILSEIAAQPLDPDALFTDVTAEIEVFDVELRMTTGLCGPRDAAQESLDAYRRAWEEQQRRIIRDSHHCVRGEAGLRVPVDTLKVVAAGNPLDYASRTARDRAVIWAMRRLRESGWSKREVLASTATDPTFVGLRALASGRAEHLWKAAARGHRPAQASVQSATAEQLAWLARVHAKVEMYRHGQKLGGQQTRLGAFTAVAEGLVRLAARQDGGLEVVASLRHVAIEADVSKSGGLQPAVAWLSEQHLLAVEPANSGLQQDQRTQWRLRPTAVDGAAEAGVPPLEPYWNTRWDLRDAYRYAHLSNDLDELGEWLGCARGKARTALKELADWGLWRWTSSKWGTPQPLPVAVDARYAQADLNYGRRVKALEADGVKARSAHLDRAKQSKARSSSARRRPAKTRSMPPLASPVARATDVFDDDLEEY